MDHSLQFIYNRQGAECRRQEADARGNVPALEVLADRIAQFAAVPIARNQRQRAGKLLQWSMGIGAGLLYAYVRDRIPGHGLARGLGYGAAFSLLVDEGLTPLLGLAPRPAAFPWQTHARGFVGHLVFGAVAEAVLATLCDGEEKSTSHSVAQG